MFNRKRIARLEGFLDDARITIRDLAVQNQKLQAKVDAIKPSKHQYEVMYWTGGTPEIIAADGYIVNNDKSASFFKVLGFRNRCTIFRTWQAVKSIRVVEVEVEVEIEEQ